MIIVDDEKIIREGLRDCIDWENIGIRIIAEAQDGVEALNKAYELKPDIILTDVVMPGIDGIEFIKNLRNIIENVKVIMISAYQDIEYMKSAFKYDAVDYILKPFSIDELYQVICKVKKQIEKEKYQRMKILDMQSKLKESLPLMKDNFLKELIYGNIYDLFYIEKKIKELDINLPLKQKYIIMDINIHNKDIYENSNFDFSQTNESIQKIITQYSQGIALKNNSSEYLGIVPLKGNNDDKNKETVLYLANSIMDAVNRNQGIDITIGVGSLVEGIENVSTSFKHARAAVAQRVLIGKNRIIFYDDIKSEPRKGFPVELFQNQQQIIKSFKEFDKSGVNRHIHELFENIRYSQINDLRYIYVICTDTLMQAIRCFAVLFDINEIEEVAFAFDGLYLQKDIYEIENFMIDQLTDYIDRIEKNENRRTKKVIREIVEIIDKTFMEDITIQKIADAVYLSPNHISAIFKQETGITINDYLTKVRMDEAIKLLSDSHYKIYEIALKVGYKDANHFSKLFKKHIGLTPTTYREIKSI